jgi:D-alanine transfer protein
LNPSPGSSRLHLHAFFTAAAVTAVVLAGWLQICLRLERRDVHEVALDLTNPKTQGIALQQAAIARDDLLLLYGSSELVKDVPYRATEFFAGYPSGFRVFPVGKEGTVALATLQKLAALGPHLRGRKVALSLSPSFFLEPQVSPEFYAGNFSALQAHELAFSGALSPALKRDAAARMREYRDTLRGEWVLGFALDRLAADTAVDHALYGAVWPLGKLCGWVGRAQDHFEAGLEILEAADPADPRPGRAAGIKWAEVMRRATELGRKNAPGRDPRVVVRPRGSRDRDFVANFRHGDEWEDFELILRTLQEMGAKPLLIAMPLHGVDLEASGVSAQARKAFGDHLEAVAGRYEMPLVYFEQFEGDTSFFADHQDHPGARGWALYNQTLDAFFHGQL